MDFFSGERFVEASGWILPYLSITLEFVVICVVLATLLGILVAAARMKKIPVLSQIIGIYISYMRGTPILVQLMVVYYGLPVLIYSLFGVNISRWDAFIFAEIAMVLNEGAFLSENIRGALLAVPVTQTEAAYSIGMTKFQSFHRIVLPQAIRTLIPSYGTTLVGILQGSSMLYTIGVMEIMMRARAYGNKTSHTFEAYAVCAVIYIIASLIIKFLSAWLERRMNYGSGVSKS